MSRLPSPIAAGLLAGCSLLAAEAAAQESTLPLTTVTAKGYAGEDLQTPLAAVSLNRDELMARGAANAGDALRGVPGLAVASDGPQGQNPVIRGLKKESIALLIDGMRVNSAQPAGAIASLLSLGLADRLEVVKGPASVLYGAGAMGGAINILTPQAKFVPGAQISTSMGGDSASDALRAAAIANLSQGDHAFMLGASIARIGDYRSPAGEVAHSGYDSDSFIGQYRFRIDANQQLRVSLQRHRDDDVWYPGSAKPGTPPALGVVTVRAPKQERKLAEVGYSRKDGGTLNFDVRAYRQEVRRQIQAYAAALGRNQSETDVTFTTDGLDASANWLVHPQHLLSFGVNAWKMKAAPERYLNNNPPLFNNHVRNDPFRDGKIDALGLYVQDDARFGQLNVLAGLRYDRIKGSAESMSNGAVRNGLARSDHATSGSLGAIYEVSPLLRPYANLSRGFRAGEMRERFEASPRGDGYYYVGNPQIRPEKATQFELGLKGEDSRFSYSLSAYRSRISDYITGRVTGAVNAGLPVKQTENIGRATLKGLEFQGRWQVVNQQWLTAAYSRIRGENDDLREPLFQMPADEASLGWQGRIAGGWNGDATLRMVKRQDRVARLFARGTENATAGFGTADLGLTYRWTKNSLRIALKNLADKAYHEHLTEGLSGQEIQAPGRSLALNWQSTF
ncbi:TonB-dependent receptor [Pseudoduganella violacea]|uniref:Hemoglobin/transferrin/lactoferrin receptor protein n=1 Tax=Pseudoduganella violacea TaxID=1715466 RepID=A0A7W5B5T9_9BURK|nr:TonB-dependent receptor [Pseudoduganella violacea]MBB3117099.1 hemoglobin/transferrin/lactoferrin receptor protein [Pseudoduganella violacea]